MKKQLTFVLLLMIGLTLNSQIFSSPGGYKNEAASQAGEPNKAKGTVFVKTAPNTKDSKNEVINNLKSVGIPKSVYNNSRFLGNGTFSTQISDTWAVKQTAKKVRRVTSKNQKKPPNASNKVIYIFNAQQLNNNRNRIKGNEALTFVFQGKTNVTKPILVGKNKTIWIDGVLNYNGFDAPRTAFADFTPRPSKYDGVFSVRPEGNFHDERDDPNGDKKNSDLLKAKFKGNKAKAYTVSNVNFYGTSKGELIIALGKKKDPSGQILPQVNGICLMNTARINIEGITIKNAFQGIYIASSFNANFRNNFIFNTLYRAIHLHGTQNRNSDGFGAVENNLLFKSSFDGIDIDSFSSSFIVKENVVIGARDRFLVWTEIDAKNNEINNNVGIILDDATAGQSLGSNRGAFQENGTEAERNPNSPKFNPKFGTFFKGTSNNKWLNNHSFYAEFLFDGFVMRSSRFIQFNTITFKNNYVWTLDKNMKKHNPKPSVSDDVFYLIGKSGSNNGGGNPDNTNACNANVTLTGVKTIKKTDNSITIDFNEIKSTSTYELRAFAKNTFNGNINSGAIAYKSGNSSPLTITNLKKGTEYTLVLRAVCSQGGSTKVSKLNISTTGGNISCNSNVVITGIKATQNTKNSVTIAFNELSNTNAYELRAFPKNTFNGNINSGAIAFKGGNNSPLTISDNNLKEGTEYTFVLRALCASGGGSKTVQINAKTKGANPCNANATISNMKLTQSSNGSVTIAFDQLSSVKTYELRAFAKNKFNGNVSIGAIGFKQGNDSPLTIKSPNLKLGTEYTFVLRAICNVGGASKTSQINGRVTNTANRNNFNNYFSKTDSQNVNNFSKTLIYPNPVNKSNVIYINNLTIKNMNVTIYDLAGNKVIYNSVKNLVGGSYSINTKDLAKGIYIIQLNSNNSQKIEKLIVK